MNGNMFDCCANPGALLKRYMVEHKNTPSQHNLTQHGILQAHSDLCPILLTLYGHFLKLYRCTDGAIPIIPNLQL